MDNAVLPSTFFLTLLLMIGLFFFIRASVKDRTQRVRLISEQPEDLLLPQLKQYFAQRAYQVTHIDGEQNQVTLEGFVKPSLPLAVFLAALAATGMLCLALVLAILLPEWTSILMGLVLLSPAAGLFYWQKAGRVEQVSFKVEETTPAGQSAISVTAHRDELAELCRGLNLKQVEE
ncbi:hypothetical protein BST81_15945 [Leptolyngbya sp. 'hensonii']|uniref:cofactor assembly of complex C subunit B n=1 Tax=Leptolyngbya sp. 'hensonii' TaxID=1922337 RepID=UPI00094FB4E9|nr:cofactor assembly of complex C subunit B [Leptolyngbya sp. 'hensonii']OLP17301.1 hypothetical protein BST81_15945 [Leptolyngbya sp. 'hensonii']